MFDVRGYALGERVPTASRSIVFRGRRLSDARRVVLKTSRAERPDPRSIARLESELALLRRVDSEHVIEPLALIRAEARPLLISIDGGDAVGTLVGNVEQPRAVWIATQIAAALAALHAEGIMHRDVTLSNVVLDADDRARLIDLGSATPLARERATVVEGTPAYISPEQTGRMNRAVDYRSDHYSLGVCLYELLAGRLPFDSDDPAELIYCHVAKTPPPLGQVTAELAGVVDRLMAKDPERRYQSAGEIVAALAPFSPHALEVSAPAVTPPLSLGAALYGRDAERRALSAAFERAAAGGRELVLLSGEPGIGKTALAAALHRPVLAARAWFGVGKFEQLRRDKPLLGLQRAFRELARQRLTRSDAELAAWKAALDERLGDDIALLVEWIGDLAHIFAGSPAPIALPPDAAQARYARVIRELVQSFAHPGAPLVLLIDDLQWADETSLTMLETLLRDRDSSHLLVVGAFRDGDLAADHPLRLASRTLAEQGVHVEALPLQGLAESDVAQLIEALAPCSDSGARAGSEVAKHVHRRTRGNPLFVRELLRSLHDGGAIHYDGGWTFDVDRIADAPTPPGAVELVRDRLRALDTKRWISYAACIGHRFDLETLAVVTEQPPAEMANALLPAVDAGVIEPIDDGLGRAVLGQPGPARCRFAHDQVQRAAIELLDDAEVGRVRANLGRRLAAQLTDDELKERVFEIAGHLNAGFEVLGESHRSLVARIDLIAAQCARAATAHGIAGEHAHAGLTALGDSDDTTLRFDLGYERCHALAMAGGPIDALDGACRELWAHAPTDLARLRLQSLLVRELGPRGHHERAIALGLEALAELGVVLDADPTGQGVVAAWADLQGELGDRSIDEVIASLEPSASAEHILIGELFAALGTSVWATRFELLSMMTLEATRFIIRHGATPVSPEMLSGWGFALAHLLDDYEAGYAFGRAAIALGERLGALRGGARHLTTVFLSWFKQPYAALADEEERAFREARDAGNHQMAGHAAAAHAVHLWRGNVPIEVMLRRIAPYDDYFARHDHYYSAAHDDVRQAAKNLSGAGAGGPTLSDDGYDQDAVVRRLEAMPSPPGIRLHYLMRAELQLLYGDYDGALISLEIARPIATPGEYELQDGMCYWGICVALTGSPFSEQLPQLIAHLERYASRIAPENFSNRLSLLRAEYARLSRRSEEAARHYDRAIALSREHGLLRDEGLAAELAARFHLARGDKVRADELLRNARDAFVAYGATAKVRLLSESFPPLSTAKVDSAALDVQDLLAAAKAISAQIDSRGIVTALLGIAQHSAGARFGAVALPDGDDWSVIASDGRRRALPAAGDVPVSMIRLVTRTGEEIALDDATVDPIFAGDPHVRKFEVLSVFCAPLSAQGELVGVLYLQNEQVRGAFGVERHAIIRALGAQTAIALRNAHLFGEKQDLAQRLATILDTVGDGVIVLDGGQTIRMINSEVERIFGYKRDELLGEPVKRIMPQRYHADHDAAFTKRLSADEPMAIRYVEVEGRRRDGSELPLELRFAEARIDGEVLFVGALRDITERVKAREEIERLSRALEQERDYLREEVKASGQFGDIVGDSPALKMVLAQVEAVAKTNATVLIGGESGVGKELFARAIHERSPRADKPLVKVNCASVPRELFESEFFGHRKGAFTGAVRDRVGRFQLAHEGTIFLDEVGEIPLELQSKLLRVLQEHELERVGDDRTVKIDVRVVAATNRDLRQEVGAGRFREDLYYRLGVFPVQVPPLRERREDIVPLALHFLTRAARNLGSPVPKLPTAVGGLLTAYAWPGNIRELQNVIERAAILAASSSGGRGTVTEEMLYLQQTAAAKVSTAPRSVKSELDADTIRRALEEHHGNIARVASALGLSRQALYRRMEKFGIERPSQARAVMQLPATRCDHRPRSARDADAELVDHPTRTRRESVRKSVRYRTPDAARTTGHMSPLVAIEIVYFRVWHVRCS